MVIWKEFYDITYDSSHFISHYVQSVLAAKSKLTLLGCTINWYKSHGHSFYAARSFLSSCSYAPFSPKSLSWSLKTSRLFSQSFSHLITLSSKASLLKSFLPLLVLIIQRRLAKLMIKVCVDVTQTVIGFVIAVRLPWSYHCLLHVYYATIHQGVDFQFPTTTTSFACPWQTTGGVFTFIQMTWYPNDRNIRFGTLLKEGERSEPSFTKVLHPIFWFWYFEAVRFASQIFLHQSTTSYFLIFGISSYFLILVLWSSQIHFIHLPAPKYCILIF